MRLGMRIPGLVRQNCSAISQLLRWNGIPKRLDLSGVKPRQYDAAAAHLDRLAPRLSQARPAGTDGALVMRELEHAMAMARYAIDRGRYLHLGVGDVDDLRGQMQGLIMSHEDQWLARNRRGGLRESSSNLRKLCVGTDD